MYTYVSVIMKTRRTKIYLDPPIPRVKAIEILPLFNLFVGQNGASILCDMVDEHKNYTDSGTLVLLEDDLSVSEQKKSKLIQTRSFMRSSKKISLIILSLTKTRNKLTKTRTDDFVSEFYLEVKGDVIRNPTSNFLKFIVNLKLHH